MDSTFPEEEMTTGDQNLATQMGWCPMQNAWVTSWMVFTDHERHKDNRGWESASTPLQWADPLPLLTAPGTPEVGKNFFLDEKCPVRGVPGAVQLDAVARGGRRARGAAVRKVQGVGNSTFVLFVENDNDFRSRCE